MTNSITIAIIGLMGLCLSVSGFSGAFIDSAPSHLLLRVIERKRDLEQVYDSYSALTDRKDPIAIKAALDDVKSDDDYLWVGAAHYLGALDRIESIPYLIKALRHTAWRGDADRIKFLQSMTGEEFGRNFAAWKDWWVTENPDCRIIGIPTSDTRLVFNRNHRTSPRQATARNPPAESDHRRRRACPATFWKKEIKNVVKERY